MSRPILEIRSGDSNSQFRPVNLLQPQFGYLLCDWRPSRPNVEMDMQKNTFTGVEYPRAMVHNASVSSLTLNARDVSQDQLIADERKLINLLQQANRYWVKGSGVDYPVYLRVKARDESITREAMIITAQYHDDSSPFAQPFASVKPASTELVVAITHDLFTPVANTGYPTIYAFNGAYSKLASKYYGLNMHHLQISDYHTERLSVANFEGETSLTHVFTSSGGTDNMLDKADGVTYTLFETGDWTYFGCESPGDLNSLYQDVYQVFNNITGHYTMSQKYDASDFNLTAQYWNGSWEDIDVTFKNDLAPFSPSRVYSFTPPHDWVSTTVNSVSGLFIRMRLNSGREANGVVAAHPYAVNTNHVTIDKPAIGDAGCRVQLEFAAHGSSGSDTVWENAHPRMPTNIFMGVKKNHLWWRYSEEQYSYRDTFEHSVISTAEFGKPSGTYASLYDSYWDRENTWDGITTTRPYDFEIDKTEQVSPYKSRTLFRWTREEYYQRHSLVFGDGLTVGGDENRPNSAVSIGRVTFTKNGRHRVFCRFGTHSKFTNDAGRTSRSNQYSEFFMWANVGSRDVANYNSLDNYSEDDLVWVKRSTTKQKFKQNNQKTMVLDLGSIEFDGHHQVLDFVIDMSSSQILRDSEWYIYDVTFIPDEEFFVQMSYRPYIDGQIVYLAQGKGGETEGAVYPSLDSSTLSPGPIDNVVVTPDRSLQLSIQEASSLYFFMTYEDDEVYGAMNSDFHSVLDISFGFTPLFLSAIGDAS